MPIKSTMLSSADVSGVTSSLNSFSGDIFADLPQIADFWLTKLNVDISKGNLFGKKYPTHRLESGATKEFEFEKVTFWLGAAVVTTGDCPCKIRSNKVE